MHQVSLTGCTATPFGNYLKALGVLRLVSDQVDFEARASWNGDTLQLTSQLDGDELLEFFLKTYSPTPILAPWNGGSGFYDKDRKIGIDAIAASTDPRFDLYRRSIEIVRNLEPVRRGKAEKNEEDERRSAILRECRNRLPDSAVEWLDAAVGIAADGSRAFAPVLGTGGNEGRLDYTNNFMERLAGLLIQPDKRTPVRELLVHALFGERTEGLQSAAAGQFDPGKAGGANQGQGISADSVTNPWDFVLTVEGAVSWASGLYRRQAVGYRRSLLCSPFTVGAVTVGYGSGSSDDQARAEIWAPLWNRPARYAEIRVLLREGRATVKGRPAETGMQFAEAASSLGVDRGIDRFVRYSLLKRRGDSYVALPAGIFPVRHRSESDRIREIDELLDGIKAEKLPPGCEALDRRVETAMFETLLHGGEDRLRDTLAALGRLVRRLATVHAKRPEKPRLKAVQWLPACGSESTPEVRIAAAVASIWDKENGGIRDNLVAGTKAFSWTGRDVSERMLNTLDRRLQISIAAEATVTPFGGSCQLHPGDATSFIEGSVDDDLIEDLLYAFLYLDWTGFRNAGGDAPEVMPVYSVLKHLFLPDAIEVSGERKRLWPDGKLISLLRANRITEAAEAAVRRLRIAGLCPINTWYYGGPDPLRLGAALLIPVWTGKILGAGVLHEREAKEAHA